MNEKLEQLIIDFLQEKLSPYLVVLFGSTVKGTLRNDSDLDIAFLAEQNHNAYEIFLIAQQFASHINRDVDLVDLNQASTVFQAQIVSTGKVIYCSDETKRAHFYMKTLKMYAKLNEERAPILLKVQESGRIYGK